MYTRPYVKEDGLTIPERYDGTALTGEMLPTTSTAPPPADEATAPPENSEGATYRSPVREVKVATAPSPDFIPPLGIPGDPPTPSEEGEPNARQKRSGAGVMAKASTLISRVASLSQLSHVPSLSGLLPSLIKGIGNGLPAVQQLLGIPGRAEAGEEKGERKEPGGWGTEEWLLIGLALFLFFSAEGDRECAVILLLLLFV